MVCKYPSWCCQKCGAEIGWLGRFLDFIHYSNLLGFKHKCIVKDEKQ